MPFIVHPSPFIAPLPYFSTISYNFKHRFTPEQIFTWILSEANKAGCLDPEVVFIDGTHIKANANVKKQIPEAVKIYNKQLMDEVNADRESHGKNSFNEDDDEPRPGKTKETVFSTTDPESGLFHKGEHKKCFAYEAHTAYDEHNFVLDITVTPGNVHDSVAFNELYDLGAMYRKRKCEKTVTRHVWHDYVERAEYARYTLRYKKLYARRKQTIERVFADAKEKYAGNAEVAYFLVPFYFLFVSPVL